MSSKRSPPDPDGHAQTPKTTTSSADALMRTPRKLKATPPPRLRDSSSTRAKTGRVKRPGLVDGRYELERLLNAGGMGRVFRARHRNLGRSFALKLVLDGFQDNQEMRELFFQEARMASLLSHPNVVAVTDFGFDDELGLYLVMELLDGETLRQRMRRQRLNLRVICDLIDQTAGALQYCHGRDVIHCDLKPENVFLQSMEGEPRRHNVVKLIDFGLSWKAKSLPGSQLGGTPPYLAPECLRGEPPSPASDIYSLGMVCYELIAGGLPLHGTPAEMIAQTLAGKPLPPPSRYADEPIDQRADDLISRALSLNPAQRHPSAEAFRFELRALMGMIGMNPRRRGRGDDSGAHAVFRDTGARPKSDREQSLARAFLETPVPIAVLERSGAVRVINEAFTALATPSVAPPSDLEAFQLRAEVPLRRLFEEAIGTGELVFARVLIGSGDTEQPMVLVLRPCMRSRRIDSVHATLVPFDLA